MAAWLTASAAPEPPVLRFPSGEKFIRVEVFSVTPEADTPALLVLHGSTGVAFANRFVAGLAAGFAQQGYVVYLLHYFDRTGTSYADNRTIRKSFEKWAETVSDAVEFIHQQRPKAKIGVFGYSLGGYLTAAVGVRNPQVSAAVVLSGGIDEKSIKVLKHPSPTLILHGAEDQRVPASEARQLEKALRAAGGKPELHLYPGEGHLFSMPIYADIVTRGAAFFGKHLGIEPLE